MATKTKTKGWTDPNKLLPVIPSPHGAQMGRRNITDNQEAKVHVFRVRFVDGDYDMGGVYWGGGRDSLPLYCALSRELDFMVFTRCLTRDEMKDQLREDYPHLTFYG